MKTTPTGRVGSKLALAALCCAASMWGCSHGARMGAGPEYPRTKVQSAVVDVQLARSEERVTLTNTSPRSFPAATLWLNAQYGSPVPELPAGRAITLDLSAFKNEYGESFRAGGFFATERPDTVVLAQLELEDELIGMPVVKGKP